MKSALDSVSKCLQQEVLVPAGLLIALSAAECRLMDLSCTYSSSTDSGSYEMYERVNFVTVGT